jgi:hypothetical protein
MEQLDNFCPRLDKNSPKTDKKALTFCPSLAKVLSGNGQKLVKKMTENDVENAIVIGQKQGIPVYEMNPSVPHPDSIKKRKSVRFGDDKRGFVVDGGNGEVLSVGSIGFYEFEEVDNTRFVKLFLAGVKQAAGLSKAGLSVFELVYTEVQENPGIDEIKLTFYGASKQIKGLNDRTFRRGLRELLEKEFIFRSPANGVFFVNIRYMFNGDRLAFVKGYSRKLDKSKRLEQADPVALSNDGNDAEN